MTKHFSVVYFFKFICMYKYLFHTPNNQNYRDLYGRSGDVNKCLFALYLTNESNDIYHYDNTAGNESIHQPIYHSVMIKLKAYILIFYRESLRCVFWCDEVRSNVLKVTSLNCYYTFSSRCRLRNSIYLQVLAVP